jgi:hypothetical protein
VSSDLLSGAYSASALLLVAAGAAKALRPHDTARALSQAGLRAGPVAVRAAAVVETVLGALALTAEWGVVSLLVALSYLGFAVFVVVAWSRDGPLSSCGCFGKDDAPASIAHALVDLAFAAIALTHPASLVSAVRDQPLGGVPLMMLTALTAYLAYLVMAVLPRAQAAARAAS